MSISQHRARAFVLRRIVAKILVVLTVYCVLLLVILRYDFTLEHTSHPLPSVYYPQGSTSTEPDNSETENQASSLAVTQRYTTGGSQSFSKFESSPGRTYAYVFFYPGQQGTAILAIASFQCFLASLRLRFTFMEPQVSHNMWGYTNCTDYMMLSDMFDLEDFTSQSHNIQLVSKSEFVRNSPISTVILFPGQTKAKILWSKGSCLEKDDLRQILAEHYGNRKEYMAELFLETMSVRCVVRIVKLPVYGERIKRLAKIKRLIFGHWSPNNVTLIFQQWRTPYRASFGDKDATDCLKLHSMTEDQVLFKPSQRLLHDAQKYKKIFLGKGRQLTIMFRIERLVRNYLLQDGLPSDLDTAEECFQRVLNLSNTLRNCTENPYPMVTMDVGSFGSVSFRNFNASLRYLTNETFSMLYRDKWSMESWERSFVEATGGVTNSAYIAALQRVLASRSDCLILLGGGNFQALAARDYEQYHSGEKCVHLVCTMTRKSIGL